MRGGLLLLSLLAGCHCGPAPESEPPSESGESGDTEDSGVIAPVEILVVVEEPEDTLVHAPPALAVVQVGFGDGPSIGATIAAATGDGTETLALPDTAPPEHLEALGNLYLPVSGALYMIIAFEDDGDGAYQEGERVLGVAMDRWVMWYELDLGIDDSGGATPVRSWRVVDLGIAGQYAPNRCALDTSWPLEWMMDLGFPQYHPVDEPITVTLRGLEADLSLAGNIVDLPEDPLRFAALPYPHVGEREVQAGFDQSVGAGQASFEAELVEAPPAEDDVGADPDWRYTMHLLMPYADSDGSGAWNLDDELEGSATCLDGEHAWARYTRPVSSYRGFRFLDCYSGTVGWRLVRYADSGGVEYLSSSQAEQLVLDFTDCRLD